MMNKLIIFLFVCFFFAPLSFSDTEPSLNLIRAQEIKEYTLLAPIPLNGELTSRIVDEGGDKSIFSKYIPGIFTTLIAFAAVLAVVRIIWGGVLYISTDAINSKSEGKKFITESIYGLVLISAAWLILFTINPKLVEVNLSVAPAQVNSNGVGPGQCLDCTQLSSRVPVKNGIGTQVSPQMATALDQFAQAISFMHWQVTEAYPPTASHSQTGGHYDGNAVDANFTQGTATDVGNINTFIDIARTKNLTAKWEVRTEEEKTRLAGNPPSGVPASSIIVNPSATAAHFHITR